MRTGTSVVLLTLIAAMFLVSSGIAQDCSGGSCSDSTVAPFNGLYFQGGARFIDYDGLDGSLKALGYDATDNALVQGGLTIEYLDGNKKSTRPTSSRISLYFFGLPEEFDLDQGVSGEISGWGAMLTGVMPIVYNHSTRFAFTLGIGWEWTTLTVRKEITFEDFIDNATDNAAEAERHSAILQPGLRFDYRFRLFGDPLILGLEAGYSWDFASDGTWGEKIVGMGDDTNSGFYAALSFGVPFRH